MKIFKQQDGCSLQTDVHANFRVQITCSFKTGIWENSRISVTIRILTEPYNSDVNLPKIYIECLNSFGVLLQTIYFFFDNRNFIMFHVRGAYFIYLLFRYT